MNFKWLERGKYLYVSTFTSGDLKINIKHLYIYIHVLLTKVNTQSIQFNKQLHIIRQGDKYEKCNLTIKNAAPIDQKCSIYT